MQKVAKTKEIEKYDFKQGLPQELEIINFTQLFDKSLEKVIKPHRTEFYQIIWFQNGSPTHLVDFNPINIKPNTLLFINKNSVQIFDNSVSYNGKIIIFTDHFFCKTETDTRFLRSSILFNDLLSISQIDVSETASTFTDIFQQLEKEWQHPKDSYQSDILRNYLRNFLLHAERQRHKKDFLKLKKDPEIDNALILTELLDAHFINEKKVNFYCEQMHVTPKKLNQATSKIFGKTPKQLINDRVILESKRLLSHTNESIKEIGFSLCFDEPTNSLYRAP